MAIRDKHHRHASQGGKLQSESSRHFQQSGDNDKMRESIHAARAARRPRPTHTLTADTLFTFVMPTRFTMTPTSGVVS